MPQFKPPARPMVVEVESFEIGDSEEAALQAIHSLPAWSAAVERYRFLARRGQSGPVHGTLIETDDGLALVDESSGDGALSIPVAVPATLALALPMRGVLWGSWKPETSPSWRWHATRVAQLQARSEPAERVARLSPIEAPRPKSVALASVAGHRGAEISFVIKKRSARAGDGWLIADDNQAPAAARLLMPGERETYGDQSALAADERWNLKKNTRYWISIGSFRAARQGELPVYKARSAPHWDPKAPSAAAPIPASP